MQNKPDPLVPADVDLTDFKFMPLEVARLLQSEWWIVACAEDPRRAVAAINLWAWSWHQRPAASVPDNDVVLAKMADVPLAIWREIRDAVMEPWVLCADGRWYHPVVAEKALAAWQTKLGYAERTGEFKERQRARASKGWETRRKNARSVPDECPINEAALPDESPLNANESNRKSKRDSKRDSKKEEKYLLSDAEAPDDADQLSRQPSEGYTAEFEAWWVAYPRKDSKRTAFLAFKRAKGRVPVERLMAGASAYAKRRKGEDPAFTKQPATWLNGDCWNDEPEKKSKDWFPGYVPFGVGG